MNNRQKIFSTLVISAAISACGGGGGGGTPTPPAQIINEANLVEVSQLSYSSGLLLTAFEVLAAMPGAEALAGMPGFDVQFIDDERQVDIRPGYVFPNTAAYLAAKSGATPQCSMT